MFSKRFWNRLRGKFQDGDQDAPMVITRRRHGLSRNSISPNALKVLYRLKKAGYSACLVGGSVRDVLLKKVPKDYDIATDAAPEEVRQLFRNSRLIGRRFRLVHVYFRHEIIEVSTFRANSQEQTKDLDRENNPLMIHSDNTYGTIEEDAWRRDFTVNALYYNIADFSIIDYTGGMLDLKHKVIRMIGDPVQRFHEDPVRLLRAIRLAAKLNFTIHEETEKPLKALKSLLQHVPKARLFDEMIKLFFEGNAVITYKKLQQYHYLSALFPQTTNALTQDHEQDQRLLELALKATDERFVQGKSLNPGFLLAIFLWPSVQNNLRTQKDKHKKFSQGLHYAIDTVLTKQTESVVIPRRLTAMMRSVWLLQYHLARRRGKRVYRTLSHRYFRAAYDFLWLRAESGEPYRELVEWWKRFQSIKPEARDRMVQQLARKKP